MTDPNYTVSFGGKPDANGEGVRLIQVNVHVSNKDFAPARAYFLLGKLGMNTDGLHLMYVEDIRPV